MSDSKSLKKHSHSYHDLKNADLRKWIAEMELLCEPDSVYVCNGSKEEFDMEAKLLVDDGVFVPLKRPGSYWCHSDPSDVARVEARTFICSQKEEDAGPTNHWMEPNEMKQILKPLFTGCMKGRVMYVIPFSMGPLGSPLSIIGVQITDSPYVVCNMRIMTRMGDAAIDVLGESGKFVPCMHSVGVPLNPGEKGPKWPCRPDDKYIVHFPEERSIYSFGSGYGGNALLGKKCLALRIASSIAKEEGWMAEHMLILGLTNPEGVKKYILAAFPSACGKTNLAMLRASLPGWKAECVGDDISWMRIKEDGKLYAINPENGFFGVAPGTSYESNYNAMKSIESNSIFTNVALTEDNDVWWEGMTEEIPEKLIDWKGNPWKKGSTEKASHPNARFTAPAEQCPIISDAFNETKGVPISAIIFGGRREKTIPLVFESLSWQHGTYLGASLASETTAAAIGAVGKLRHDPFAMLPFCGYNMGDYIAHWLEMGKKSDKMPKIFYVNWFRKGKDGEFLWPGFSDNIRVIDWMFNRIDGKLNGIKSPIGIIPDVEKGEINLEGLSLSPEQSKELFSVDKKEFLEELKDMREYFSMFKEKLPTGMVEEMDNLAERLS